MQAILLPSAESLRRLYTLESELALLLRVGYHNRKRGAQTLYAMGALRHLSSCRAIDAHLTVRQSHISEFQSNLRLSCKSNQLVQLVSILVTQFFVTTIFVAGRCQVGASEGWRRDA